MLLPYATERTHRTIPWVTYTLVGINVLVHLALMASGPERYVEVVQRFAYVSNKPSAVYTMFTMMFLHAPGPWHLVFNMLFLVIFGPQVEDALGHLLFGVFYVVSNVGACLLYTVIMRLCGGDLSVPSLGASGAIAGVLGMFAMRFYSTRVRTLFLFFIPLRVPSTIFLGLWVGYELREGLLDAVIAHGTSGVANWAHIGGFLFGVLAGAVLGVVTDARKEYALERPIESESDRKRVVGALRGVLRQLPHDAAANLRLAELLDMSPEEAGEAPRHYAEAIRGYCRAGQPERAVEAYRKFLARHAFSELGEQAHQMAAASLEELGDAAGAAQVYEEIAARATDPDAASLALVRLAQAALRMGQRERARAALAKVVREMPGAQWADYARNLLQQL